MLLTLANLKSRLNISNSADDSKLTDLITQVGKRFENFCDRVFERAASQVYYFDCQKVFQLKLAPVESLTLHYDIDRAFTSDTLLVANDDYVLTNATGLVRLLFQPNPEAWPDAIKATVTGGYVSAGSVPSAGQTAIPEDITRAMLAQCEYEHKNHPEFGRQSVNMQGQSVSVAEFQLLPEVKNTLQPYKRITI